MNITTKDAIIFITVVSATIGIALGLISIYEKIFPGDELTIEQRLSPEMMEKLKNGDGTITIEKSITITPEEEICDDTGSGSDQTDIPCD
jgi:hypothetical protein